MTQLTNHTRNLGFTLIEVLVVIAIIGILAGVIVASLGDARQGGQDSAIKQGMSSVRNDSAIFYNDNNFSYDDFCIYAATVPKLDSLKISSSAANAVSSNIGAASNGTTVTCHANAEGFALAVPLNNPSDPDKPLWCVDSAGFSGEVEEGALSSNASAIECN